MKRLLITSDSKKKVKFSVKSSRIVLNTFHSINNTFAGPDLYTVIVCTLLKAFLELLVEFMCTFIKSDTPYIEVHDVFTKQVTLSATVIPTDSHFYSYT